MSHERPHRNVMLDLPEPVLFDQVITPIDRSMPDEALRRHVRKQQAVIEKLSNGLKNYQSLLGSFMASQRLDSPITVEDKGCFVELRSGVIGRIVDVKPDNNEFSRVTIGTGSDFCSAHSVSLDGLAQSCGTTTHDVIGWADISRYPTLMLAEELTRRTLAGMKR